MKHVVPHDLGLDRAKQVAQKALDSYQERFSGYSPKADWVTESRAAISFSVKGMSLKGAVEVLERGFEMDLEVPFLLRPFKNTALGVIEDEIKKWIKKEKAGEL